MVEKLEIKQYRNISNIILTPGGRTHLFIGDNAQGKTNILEALYVLAFGKSHRTRSHQELIQFDCQYAQVRALVKKNTMQQATLGVSVTEKGKRLSINGIEKSRASEYIGSLLVVMFAPEDLGLVKGAPNLRRRFMDTEIGQVSRSYVHTLSQCTKVLKQRNQLLKHLFKKRSTDTDVLDVLSEQFAELSCSVWRKRYAFLSGLTEWAQDIHAGITDNQERLHVSLCPSLEINPTMTDKEMQEFFISELKKVRNHEILRGSTTLGPHRDDLEIKINGMSAAAYGSQGQQRTAALSLKLAGLEFIHHKMNMYPVLLLDDVLSELDDKRKSHLLNTVYERVQTFVTSTSLDGIDQRILDNADIYRVEQGTIDSLRIAQGIESE